MRENAEQVEIAARAHDFSGFVEQLDFASGVGDAAVFFVGRGSREYDIGESRGFGEEQFVDDQEAEVAASCAGLRKMGERICADNIEAFKFAGLCGGDH